LLLDRIDSRAPVRVSRSARTLKNLSAFVPLRQIKTVFAPPSLLLSNMQLLDVLNYCTLGVKSALQYTSALIVVVAHKYTVYELLLFFFVLFGLLVFARRSSLLLGRSDTDMEILELEKEMKELESMLVELGGDCADADAGKSNKTDVKDDSEAEEVHQALRNRKTNRSKKKD
jgi:hypothetical protein